MNRYVLMGLIVALFIGCGGVPGKKLASNTIKTSTDNPHFIYGSGEARGEPTVARDTLLMNARKKAVSQIAGYLWSDVESEGELTTEEGASVGGADYAREKGTIKVRTRAKLDASLYALIRDVPGSTICRPGFCQLRQMLKRSDARASYDAALKVELQDFREHGKKALTRGDDIFAFSGDFASASLAYETAQEVMKRRFKIDPSMQSTPGLSDAQLWERLTRERSRRSAELKLTILPLEQIGFRSSIKLQNVPDGSDKTLNDVSLADEVRDKMAETVRKMRVKTEVAERCTQGLSVRPSAKMVCRMKSMFLCDLNLGGRLAVCGAKDAVAEFRLTGVAIGADMAGDYGKIRTAILRKLSQPVFRKSLAKKLRAHMPVAQ